MVSAIDATKPVDGVPAVKDDLRANLLAAKNEIEALQAADAPIDDTTAVVKNPVDNTKLVRIDASNVGAGQTRVLTMPDEDVDLGALLGVTRPQLKALNASDGITVRLDDGLKSGAFQFDPQDLSLEVTSDPLEGIFIAPSSDPTGASGAWVRDGITPKSGGLYNILWFGADPTGATDSAPAVQAAINMAKFRNRTVVRVPTGSYLINTSIDVTYDGLAAGLESGYYGFTIEGDNPFGSRFNCRTNGTPGFDFTGKTRMSIKDVLFINSNDTADKSSCAVLFARNLNNGYGGGHVLINVHFIGYFAETLVQQASSETNQFYSCRFELFGGGARSCLELTDQIDTSVNSPYIDLSSHTFSGGNTWSSFYGCSFLSLPATERAVVISNADNVMFSSCYFKGQGVSTLLLEGTVSSLHLMDCRSECTSQNSILISDGANVSGFRANGRFSRGITCEDNTTISDSVLDLQFWATSSSFVLDAYDLLDCLIGNYSTNIRVRNDGRGTRAEHPKQASSRTVPTADDLSPFSWVETFTGGNAKYRNYHYGEDRWDRISLGRTKVKSLAYKPLVVNPASGSYTPDLDQSSHFSFLVNGALTIQNANSADLGPMDEDGDIIILSFEQDATTPGAVSFSARWDLQGASVDTTAGSRTVLKFIRIDPTGSDYSYVKI